MPWTPDLSILHKLGTRYMYACSFRSSNVGLYFSEILHLNSRTFRSNQLSTMYEFKNRISQQAQSTTCKKAAPKHYLPVIRISRSINRKLAAKYTGCDRSKTI